MHFDIKSDPYSLAGTSPLVPAQPVANGHAYRLDAYWAQDTDDIRQAQRLRYRVFAEELGAQLKVMPGMPRDHDIDIYDRFCEHLIVRAQVRGDRFPQVVGTYRVLTPAAARLVGGLYSEQEFDLVRLRQLRPKIAELGRGCIDPSWRTGGVMLLLWSCLAEFVHRNGLEYMLGCASVSMHDGGHAAASLWCSLQRDHLAPIEHHVAPRLPLPVEDLRRDLKVDPPPLIRGYLKCGAKLLGPPAWDPDFGTADLPMMLSLRDMPQAYRRHFLGRRSEFELQP